MSVPKHLVHDLKPLIVDMDGALLRTDVLVEGIAAALFRCPLKLFGAIFTLTRGRASFKRRIAAIANIDAETLPRRADFLEYIAAQRALGRSVHLVSAADDALCQQVAEAVGLFDSAQGSADGRNLKGEIKARAIVEAFPQGFVYAGDSAADLKVWRYAEAAVLAGASASVTRRAHALGKPIEASFSEPKATAQTWLNALRPHQWSKNVLLFAPLFLGGQFGRPLAIAEVLLSFAILSITASGTYIFNDLSDLLSDRRHRTKKMRPFASGALNVGVGLLVGTFLVAFGLAAGFILAPAFGAALLIYLVTTASYSLWLKRVAMLDVMLLAWLYTLRVLMGGAVLGLAASSWFLSFAMTFFFSLSLAKRHVELRRAQNDGAILGRGYRKEDAPLTLAFGVSTAVASVLILILYLMEEAFPSSIYGAPEWLWWMPVMVALWSTRVWMLANRGDLNDDPVEFAVKDKISLAMGILVGMTFLLAVFA